MGGIEAVRSVGETLHFNGEKNIIYHLRVVVGDRAGCLSCEASYCELGLAAASQMGPQLISPQSNRKLFMATTATFLAFAEQDETMATLPVWVIAPRAKSFKQPCWITPTKVFTTLKSERVGRRKRKRVKTARSSE